jgi:hypothetical protein
MTYPFAGLGVPDAPMPPDGGIFAIWFVLNVVVFVAFLGLTLRLVSHRHGRAVAVVADDDALRVDLRMAA